jgi:hypothetical protein
LFEWSSYSRFRFLFLASVKALLISIYYFCDELNELWLGFCSAFWKAEDDAGMMGLVGDSDVHPYVSLTVNLAG